MKKLVFGLGVMLMVLSCNQDKTAYVKNEEVVEKYYKLENMRQRYDKKQEVLSSEIDSLADGFQKLYEEYMSKRENLSDKTRQEKEQQLRQMQQRIRGKQNREGRKLQNERGKEADSIIRMMEDKIAEYAKQNGYTYIFGSNQSSNILYGDKSKDITDKVLKMLNEDQQAENDSTKTNAKDSAQ